MNKNERTSSISGFYKLTVNQRLSIIKEFAELSAEDESLLKSILSVDAADKFI